MKTVKNQWKGTDFCNKYLDNIKISTRDVHYGYLSPGEKKLHLLGPTQSLRDKWIVEIGCGAAQNCIALTKWGAKCTGIDISLAMLDTGRKLAKKNRVNIELIQGDARELSDLLNKSKYGFRRVSIFISSYAISFICHDRFELLNLFEAVRQNIEPKGLFVFCFSHPSQKPKTTRKDQGWQETYFSKKEVTESLKLAGFLVKKSIEQTTKNPSKISLEKRRMFPYQVKNINPAFDRFTHKPHTVIYVAKAS